VISHSPGVTPGSNTDIAGNPGSISAGDRNIWTTLPDSGKIFRLDPVTGAPNTFPVGGRPTAIASALFNRGVWVAGSGYGPLALLMWQDAKLLASASVKQAPTALAVDPNDGSAWSVDSSGTVTHVGRDGTAIATAQVPGARAVAVGEGATWVAGGSGLSRIGTGSPASYPVGPPPVSVALDGGVWTVSADGQVTRFNPINLKVSASARIGAAELDQIAAVGGAPVVWAISRTAKRLYRITVHDTPRVIGTVDFASAPVALAVTSQAVWVATRDRQLIEING
jgi:hypothetical protein